MNVASLENCKRLYELSGWGDTSYAWFTYGKRLGPAAGPWDGESRCSAPAYDAGYLLRKLPKFGKYTRGDGSISPFKTRVTMTVANSGTWVATMDSDYEEHGWIDPQYGDTPEDAACLLAIKLFEAGVLKREGD